MTVRLLLDMNLSPEWVDYLTAAGWEAVHWADIGEPTAPDQEIMAVAAERDFVVFTHDLDFGALLAATNASRPSVLQVRTQNTLPSAIGPMVLGALQQFGRQLEAGAIVIVDAAKVRARVLPLRAAS
ncbi:MAG: DUF5615 family PIN-like protein [Caldilineaceae bacterium]|nr:DUF5615 family PIN-like protein [Caldilineaceae bacterium]MCB9123075.1 DUF5615 family PIN-like protein [Caldilineaceae bacterium]